MQSCICNTIETVERSWANGRFTAVVRFRPDDDRLPPDYWGSEPAFVQIPTARELEDQITEAFGADRYGYPSARAKKARDRLAAGEVVEDDQGNWYYGVVEYRHSDSLFVLCQSDGHHSIRRSLGLMGVDQSLDGWIKVSRKNRQDWGIYGHKGVDEAARARAMEALEAWEAYLNGWYTGYKVELLDDGCLVEDDSCGGFQNIEDAKAAAEGVVNQWRSQYAADGGGAMSKTDRSETANAFLATIAGCGRRFFAHQDRVSRFEVDARGRVWFLDSYTGQRIYTHYEGRWRGFTQGGTMRCLVKALRDYIRTGRPPRLNLGPWPDWVCDGDLWGYGSSMANVREAATRLFGFPTQ